MTRTLIEKIPFKLPKSIEKLATGATVYDSSCSPEARVYFIDKENGYYLKRSAAGSLEREAKMSAYFHKKGLGAEVIEYVCDDGADWLLTARVDGEDCTHVKFLEEPERLAGTLGELLRSLHEIDFSGCPILDHTSSYLATAEKNYRAGLFDLSYADKSLCVRSADEAYSLLQKKKGLLSSEVLLHGDYCLPNIMLDSWRLTGFIDVGNGGVGDRHVDLFWGAWTLRFNLGTDKYRDRFFDAYGRDKITEEKLLAVSLAEVFG